MPNLLVPALWGFLLTKDLQYNRNGDGAPGSNPSGGRDRLHDKPPSAEISHRIRCPREYRCPCGFPQTFIAFLDLSISVLIPVLNIDLYLVPSENHYLVRVPFSTPSLCPSRMVLNYQRYLRRILPSIILTSYIKIFNSVQFWHLKGS